MGGGEARGRPVGTLEIRPVESRIGLKSNGTFPTTRLTLLGKLGATGEPVDSAWVTFVSVYGPIAYRFSISARLSVHEAEEVVADVMRSLLTWFRGGSGVDHSRGRFRHFFRTTVNNAIVHVRRQRRRSVDLDDVEEPGAPDASTAMEEAERFEVLRISLERLRAMPATRPRDMLIFERYVLQGESPERLAREFGMSRSRVYAIKHEITGQLRSLCERADQDLDGGNR